MSVTDNKPILEMHVEIRPDAAEVVVRDHTGGPQAMRCYTAHEIDELGRHMTVVINTVLAGLVGVRWPDTRKNIDAVLSAYRERMN